MRNSPFRARLVWPVVLLAAALALAACGASTASSTSTTAAGSAASTSCSNPARLHLVKAGQLTVGTGNPAYPPWYTGGVTKGTPWQISNPSSGQGYESAVVYAVAAKLGFARGAVHWIAVPFDATYAPGSKPYDFAIQQISYTPQRAQAVTFSSSYYDVNPAVVALAGTPISHATTIAQLRPYKLASQIGTTDYAFIQNVIRPTQTPGAFDSLAIAVQALKNHQVDGVVVDLPDAFYITQVQLSHGVIVGQFRQPEGHQEYFGMTFVKGNPLVTCVDKAITTLRANGTLTALEQRWLANVTHAPYLSP